MRIPRWASFPEKAFYIYAILIGPVWAKNLTVFALWTLSFLFIALYHTWSGNGEKMMKKAVNTGEEDDWKLIMTKKRNALYHLVTIALIGTMAAMHWWWTAALYTLGCLHWWTMMSEIKIETDKQKAKEETEG